MPTVITVLVLRHNFGIAFLEQSLTPQFLQKPHRCRDGVLFVLCTSDTFWAADGLHQETRRSSKLVKLGVENLIHVQAKGIVSAS